MSMTAPTAPRMPYDLAARLKRQTDATAERLGFSTTPRAYLMVHEIAAGLLEKLGCLPEETRDADETATFLAYTATGALAWLKLMGETSLTPYERDRVRDTATRLREAAAHLDALIVLHEEGQ
jgi:hypothetical protein